MLASRNVSYDDQNCRPSYGYSYDNIGNRKTAQEPVGELAYSPYGQADSTGNIDQPEERPALVISGPGSNLHKCNIPPFSRTDLQEEQQIYHQCFSMFIRK